MSHLETHVIPPQNRRPKILLVDDRPENLVALEKVLGDLEVELVRASSGNEALTLTLNNEFALALVDVQMPEMDGFEMVELLHQQKETELLPVIFVSAVYSGEYYKVRGVEVGAVDFIEKPIVPEILRGKVAIFLKLHAYQELQKSLAHQMKATAEDLQAQLEMAEAQLYEENRKLQQVSGELNQALGELENTDNLRRMVGLMADREIRMAELKQQIAALTEKLGGKTD